MRKELPKVYDPREVEPHIYQMWMDNGCFKADADPKKKPFSIVMPPPNVTGQLHMGHAMDSTLQDILTRFKRMQGYSALWLPGTDHAGIATQTKVDKKLKSEGISRLEDETAANTGMTFVIAVNYGGRDEITRAVRHMMMDCQDGKLVPENVTEQTVASYLDTAGIPDPDLLIRTSGEIRLSNYLLWQLAYSEIYITDCLWPDFNRDELIKAIEQFNQRDRRFGGVKA